MRDMGLSQLTDSPDNQYRANVQISELNTLNTCISIIKFNQLRVFLMNFNTIILFTGLVR
jgi:hypothetical protein